MSLIPIPFAAIVTRLVEELRTRHERSVVLEVPTRKLWLGTRGRDMSVSHHRHRAATPLGPAAGPHTQLAANIVASWLAGCRIIELKTVQIKDDLVIPRPCIDMATVGYNVEWSQELRLAESALEYVKASMLLDMLRQTDLFTLPDGDDDTLFDISVGYDLDGIRSEPVQRFLDAMRDPSALIDQLRSEIPTELASLGEVEFTPHISNTATLSTFHGCPPDEIEAIARWLMEERDLDVIIKLNPTLLGRERVREVVHDVLGYQDVRVPDSAFDEDATWEQVVGITGRMRELADTLGRGFGVKLTNTLVVENHRDFFPATEKVMYLSGPPLHVIASELVLRFRETFGAGLPISFSAGIDRKNFADAVALGLVPVTVCSDLLQPGGYGRASGYLAELDKRMQAVGADDIPAFVRRAHDPDGAGDPVANARAHVAATRVDPRYAAKKNSKPPRKLDRTLELFDCTNCDKCIPVCPNIAIVGLEVARNGGPASHQIGIVADACNDCGNCDIFCPEHGGPNLEKPRFHLTREGFDRSAPRAGLHVRRHGDGIEVWGRLDGRELHLAPGEDGGDDALARDLIALARAALAQPGWVRAAAAGGTEAP